jgi:hypothetical protein
MRDWDDDLAHDADLDEREKVLKEDRVAVAEMVEGGATHIP